jgi:nucleoside-diphosphate-sugar epimerase
LDKLNNILLAGANGFIGTFLYNKLNSSYSTTSLDYGQESSVKDYYSVDLSDHAEVRNFVDNSQKCAVLIFLVGLAHKKGKGQEIDEFRRINKQTLINLLSSLDKNNKLPNKIIFASTISVYGEKNNINNYNEDSKTQPFSPYAETKLEAEDYLLDQFVEKSWILRFAPVYSHKFQLNINRRTKMGGRYYKTGDGSAKLSLCNLVNIGTTVQGILNDKVPVGIYNISDAKEYSYNDLLKYVNAQWTIPIPSIFVKGLYIIGKMMNNIFLKENATKLISDNIFPSEKIRQYISLPATLDDCKVPFNQR